MSTTSYDSDSTFSKLNEHYISESTSGSSVSDRDNFFSSPCRAGGPNLCSLPGYNRAFPGPREFVHFDILERNRSRLFQQASQILHQHGINYHSLQFCGRLSIVDPEPSSIPTLLIITPPRTEFAQDWREVARLIYASISSDIPGISVEIIDEEEFKPATCFPVLRTDSIFVKWDRLKSDILRAAKTRRWTSLQCWRYGKAQRAVDNPVAVIITVSSARGSFDMELRRTRRVLESYGESSVKIAFIKDRFQKLNDPPNKPILPDLPIDKLYEEIVPGVSIGIRNSTAGSSTLGGLLTLRFGNEEAETFGITCFHCVWCPDNGHRDKLQKIVGAESAFERWRWLPLTKTDDMAPHLLQIDHPSLGDLKSCIDKLDKALAAVNTPAHQDLKRRVRLMDAGSDDEFVTDSERRRYRINETIIDAYETDKRHVQGLMDPSKNYLGHAVWGSGLERTKRTHPNDIRPSLRDWALIQVAAGRKLQDKIHPYKSSERTNIPLMPLSATLEHWEDLPKSGRSTGTTQGRYNGLTAVVLTQSIGLDGTIVGVETDEHTITESACVAFGQPGDSGSFIRRSNGEVIGLLTGNYQRLNVVVFQNIFDVFEDIKEVTGAAEVWVTQC